ncbi:ABC transporter permease [Limosilactobacillus secaliphilus]|uniref:Bacterial ABC transporter protein EcsB n=1 Tax=Limosilactobacillus secaliphilus TaxID=396268 RepID=A0A0R2I1R5_9LACO|nr:ABC transporter permease [Limosilactobacillus secaliphilus]KRN59177.1 bacterial ABC transporter protein EcsB [Limosilactobacillus secaliphilus]
MNKLFEKRRQRHFLLLLKYWRLVFNDHFVIALFFILGALAYSYSQALPSVTPAMWWPKWVLVLFLTLFVQLGRVASLIQKADPVFLLPQSDSMQDYFRSAYAYSWVLAIIMSLAGVLIALPLAMVIMHLSTLDIVAIGLSTICLKTANLLIYSQRMLFVAQQRLTWMSWVIPAVAWIICWFVNPLLGAVVALADAIFQYVNTRGKRVNWRATVALESDRMTGVYRFFNLFTDVPSVQGQVRRRKFADGLVNWLGGRDPWAYLFSRGLVRNTEVSGLIMRLTFLGMLIAFFIPVAWLNTVLAILMVYLIFVQLVPFYDQFDQIAFTHIYPIAQGSKVQAFRQISQKLMVIVAVLISVASLGLHLHWLTMLLNLVLTLAEAYVLVHYYLNYRIKKL